MVLHPRNLDFVFVAYGGISLPAESFMFPLVDIYSSAGGVVFIDLVTWLSSRSMMVLMSDFHRRNRRCYGHMSFSYLQGPLEVWAIPTL